MKSSIIIVILGLIYVGCRTTTYINVTKNDKNKIVRELNAYEKGNNIGAEVTIVLFSEKEIHGELLSVRDSALILCSEYGATKEELADLVYNFIIIKNNEIREFTLEGSSYVWLGIVTGQLVVPFAGALIYSTSDEPYGEVRGIVVGIIMGPIIGGIIGESFSSKTFVLQNIPTDFDWFILKPLSRYSDKEPEYLRAIE